MKRITTLGAAVRQAEEEIYEEHVRRGGSSDTVVSVNTWNIRSGKAGRLIPVIGLRVAEVAFKTQTGPQESYGSSFMQCDVPAGLAACASVERYILTLMYEWPEREYDLMDDRDRMMVCLFGEEVAR